MFSPRPVPEPGGFVVTNGIEDRVDEVLGNARTRISDLDDHVGAASTGGDDDLSRALHCVDGVVEDVGPHLIELTPERFDRRKVVRVLSPNVDADFQPTPQHQKGIVEPFVDVNALRRRLVEVRVGSERFHDVDDAPQTVAGLEE